MRECRSQSVNVKLWCLPVPTLASTMLVVNTVLLVSAVCSAANIVISSDTSISSVTSAKLKRGIVDPGSDSRNKEQLRGAQSTPRSSSPQDISSKPLLHYRNVKASDTQRVSHADSSQTSGSHAYGSVPKRQFSYASSPTQTESYQSSPITPYSSLLNNPSTYKTVTSTSQPPNPSSKSIVSQSLEKLQKAYSSSYNTYHPSKPVELSSNSQYPSYASINKIISQGFQNDGSSSTVQMPVYKNGYPVPSKAVEYTDVYAPSFPALFQSLDKTKQNEEVIDVSGKKISVPIIQLQGDSELSGAFPVFDSQPFLLNANYDSDFDFNFGDMSKSGIAQNVSPFLSPLSSFQGQVVPIQTAGSTPQFPQYKGASIEAYTGPNNVPKVQGSYESLYDQPQLHFGKEPVDQPDNPQQNVVSSISAEDILDDVEIINKKNPEPHPGNTDDDVDVEEEEEEEEEERDTKYKNAEKESEDISVEGIDESGDFKEPPLTENDFKPSTTFPFKEYDETFGKYTEQTDAEDSEDKPYSGYKNSSSDDDAEEAGPSSEYHAESPKSSGSYEEEQDEKKEESRKYEKRGERDGGSHGVEPKQLKYYGEDFEREFEESYRKELPRHRYAHIKEVPEIDIYNNPIVQQPSRRQPESNGRARANHQRSEESRAQESFMSRKNRKVPKIGYRDNVAYGTDIAAKKAAKVVYEEFYGYKNPKTGKYSKRSKSESAVEKYSPAKKSTAHKEDSYLRAAKYYKFKNPKAGSGFASKNKYPHSYSSASNWKSSKIPTAVPESNARQLADPGDRALLYRPSAVNGQARSITNAEIFRDLTGI